MSGLKLLCWLLLIMTCAAFYQFYIGGAVVLCLAAAVSSFLILKTFKENILNFIIKKLEPSEKYKALKKAQSKLETVRQEHSMLGSDLNARIKADQYIIRMLEKQSDLIQSTEEDFALLKTLGKDGKRFKAQLKTIVGENWPEGNDNFILWRRNSLKVLAQTHQGNERDAVEANLLDQASKHVAQNTPGL